MRERMDQLAALGLLDKVPWEHEALSNHLSMVARHVARACALVVINAARTLSGKSSDRLTMTDEEREMAEKCLTNPTGKLKERWDVIILLSICYSAVVVPFRVGFDVDSTPFTDIWYFEVAMTCAFLIDMVISFNTVVFDSSTGRWVLDRTRIASTYLQGWFWIDAPSSVPVEIIALFVDAQGLVLLRVLRIFRLVRLAKIIKVGDYIDTLEEVFQANLVRSDRPPAIGPAIRTRPCRTNSRRIARAPGRTLKRLH